MKQLSKHKKKKHKLYYRMLLNIFLVYFIILAETVWNFKDKNLEFPKPSWQSFINGTWNSELEAYLEENIGFHDVLFQVKNQVNLLIGEKMIQNVYVTKQGLMEKVVSDVEPNADVINNYYHNSNISVPIYFILVPTASAIYESNLPANALNSNQESFIKAVYADTENGIRCIDTYHVLNSLKDNYIYYRTDSHWTSYGAYYIYQSAIQKMGFTPVSYQRYVISHLSIDFKGDLYAKTLYHNIKPDILDCYYYETGGKITSIHAYYQNGNIQERESLYDESALYSSNTNMYQFYLGQPCEKLIIQTDLNNGKKLLLYKDDFADCMIPFLIQHYSEICVVNLEQTGANFESVANVEDYTQVLFLCSVKSWHELTSD